MLGKILDSFFPATKAPDKVNQNSNQIYASAKPENLSIHNKPKALDVSRVGITEFEKISSIKINKPFQTGSNELESVSDLIAESVWRFLQTLSFGSNEIACIMLEVQRGDTFGVWKVIKDHGGHINTISGTIKMILEPLEPISRSQQENFLKSLSKSDRGFFIILGDPGKCGVFSYKFKSLK